MPWPAWKSLHCAGSAPFLSAFHSPAETSRLCACLSGRKLIVVVSNVVFLFLVGCDRFLLQKIAFFHSLALFFSRCRLRYSVSGALHPPAAGSDGSRQKEATLPFFQANTPSSFSSFTPVRNCKNRAETQRLTYNRISSSVENFTFCAVLFIFYQFGIYGCVVALLIITKIYNLYFYLQQSCFWQFFPIWDISDKKISIPNILSKLKKKCNDVLHDAGQWIQW